MSDFKMTLTHDLDIAGGGMSVVTGQEAIAQDLDMRLSTWLAESPYDRSAGTSWREVIMDEHASNEAIETTLRRRILGTRHVLQILTLELTRNPLTRELGGSGRVRTSEGDIPFTIGL